MDELEHLEKMIASLTKSIAEQDEQIIACLRQGQDTVELE